MSALTLDVVGRALFSADLAAQAPSLRRSLAAGQRLALLGAFAPIPLGAALHPGGPGRGRGGSGQAPSRSRWTS